MKHLHLVLALALALPLASGGCDKIKEMTGGGKQEAKAESDEDEDDGDEDKKKKKKKKDKKKDKDDKGKTSSSGSPSTPPPSAPAAAAAGASHLPGDCEVAMNFNVSRIASHPAFAKEVMPLLDELLATPSPKDDDFKRFQTFMKSAGLNARSFHNVAACVKNVDQGKGKEVFAFAVGGDMKPDTLVAAFEKVRESSGKKPLTFVEVDGKKVLSDKAFTLGQFSDGVLGAASSIDVYNTMSKPNDNATAKYRLDLGKDMSLAVSDEFLAKQLKGKGGKAQDQFEKIKSMSAMVDLTTGKAQLVMGVGTAQNAKELDAFVTVMAAEFKKKASSPKLEDQILAGLTSRVDGTNLIVEVPLPPDTLNKAATMLAEELRKSKGKL